MKAKKYYLNALSRKSIANLQRELRAYKDSLLANCRRFVEELAKEGIVIAENNNHPEFASDIGFKVELNPEKDGCVALMIGFPKRMVESEWVTKEGEKSATVNPLLMAEFGSGFQAKNPMDVPGVGQGTFPGQTHAFERQWSWMTADGKWHTSSGITPTMPMYKASLELPQKIADVARRVFG